MRKKWVAVAAQRNKQKPVSQCKSLYKQRSPKFIEPDVRCLHCASKEKLHTYILNYLFNQNPSNSTFKWWCQYHRVRSSIHKSNRSRSNLFFSTDSSTTSPSHTVARRWEWRNSASFIYIYSLQSSFHRIATTDLANVMLKKKKQKNKSYSRKL